MRYLNPKADLTFKKVFGKHPDLVISFLNALLPFETPEEEIREVTYMNPELMPRSPLGKDSIVDVRCRNGMGRQFIVEMQMMWTSAYRQRVLFNASKAYVKQLEAGGDYDLLQPVYLTEINEKTLDVPKELMENPEIRKAVAELEESAFTEEQLLGYDKFWDIVSTAKTNISSSYKDGKQEGLREGERTERMKNARGMKAAGIDTELIARITGLTTDEIEAL